jgi:hypothetical protein
VRIALYLAVPAVTIAVAAVALGAIAAPRVLIGVRVWGGPTHAAGSVRIECVRRAVGIDDHVPLGDVDVEIDGVHQTVSCDADGHAEAAIARAASPGPRHLRITAKGRTLAEGSVSVSEDAWAARAELSVARVRNGGKLPIVALVPGGAMPLGQPGVVHLRTAESLRAPDSLRIAANGATVGQVRAETGGLAVTVTPRFPNASLEIERTADPPGTGGWSADLPIAPAAPFVDDLKVEGGTITGTVRSPTIRESVFASVQELGSRVVAARVAMRPDGRGGSLGDLSITAAPTAPAWLVLGTDETLSGGVAWPLASSAIALDGRRVPDARWLDGITPMHTVERARTTGTSRRVGLLVAAGALLEALLLVREARLSRQRLAAHVAANVDGDEAPKLEGPSPVVAVAVALAAILFGFAMFGVVLMLQT